jgi:hypothetical protein
VSARLLTLLLLPTSLAAQAPWEVNAPIVSVTKEVYQTHPAVGIAVNVSTRYVGPDLGAHSQRLERITWQKASDTPYNLRQRWSSDNGCTWTDWEAYEDPISRLPGGERICWTPGPSAYDPIARKTVCIWLRQTQPGDGRFSNHSFVRLSDDSGRTWGDPQLLRYEDGADFDPADPLNSEFLTNNHAYFPQNIAIRQDGALVVAGVGANIPDSVPLSEINPRNVSAYFLPADSRNLGALSFVGTWDRQEGKYDWTAGNVVWVPRHVASRGLMEPSVAELTDGRLLTIYRDSNQNITKFEDGRKRYTISTDGGVTLSAPAELKYDDGSRFYSPSSIHQLTRHSQTGKLYWVGNICTSPANGNSPRYPLVIAEVDEMHVALRKDTVALIDDRHAGDGSKLQLSNFSLLEDRDTHHLEIYLTRLGEDSANLWSANAYKYTLTLLPAVVGSEPVRPRVLQEAQIPPMRVTVLKVLSRR